MSLKPKTFWKKQEECVKEVKASQLKKEEIDAVAHQKKYTQIYFSKTEKHFYKYFHRQECDETWMEYCRADIVKESIISDQENGLKEDDLSAVNIVFPELVKLTNFDFNNIDALKMERCDFDWNDYVKQKQKEVTTREALQMLVGLLKGHEWIHKAGFTLLDAHEKNIVLCANGNGGKIWKVIDFGIVVGEYGAKQSVEFLNEVFDERMFYGNYIDPYLTEPTKSNMKKIINDLKEDIGVKEWGKHCKTVNDCLAFEKEQRKKIEQEILEKGKTASEPVKTEAEKIATKKPNSEPLKNLEKRRLQEVGSFEETSEQNSMTAFVSTGFFLYGAYQCLKKHFYWGRIDTHRRRN